MITAIIAAALVLGGIGALAAIGLGMASVKFHVEVDPRVEAVDWELPGANCGACGYAGCRSLAEAMVEGKADAAACIPGGEDIATRVAEILGVVAGKTEKKIAVVHCKGVRDKASDKGRYLGIPDCRAAALILSSPKECNYGCIGLATCERSCPFDAIHVNEEGIAVVVEEKCTACGNCVEACPKDIIDLRKADATVHIRCNNPLAGKKVKAVCKVGCIGCKRCLKECPFDAIEMQRDLAVIDDEKCVRCGLCAEVCPVDAIDDEEGPRQCVEVVAEDCIGCTKCAKVCPADAVAGERKESHLIDPTKCVSCYKCLCACPKDAIVKTTPRGEKEGAA